MAENGKKNGKGSYVVGRGKPPKETRFSSTSQPSPTAKSAGQRRRSTLMSFLQKVTEYMELSVEEFEALEKDMQINKKDYTVSDVIAYRYAQQVTEGKLLKEWSDKNISNATTRVELDDKRKHSDIIEGLDAPK